jgi:hypothetical protein
MSNQNTASSEGNELPDGEVGYRKPPRHSQFKKGQSGNPRGRPKRSGDLFRFSRHMLLNEPLVAKSGDEISKLEGIVRMYVKKAAEGHTPSFRKFLKLARKGKLFEAPIEFQGGVVQAKSDVAMVLKGTEQMRAELSELKARVARGELKELERIGHGQST